MQMQGFEHLIQICDEPGLQSAMHDSRIETHPRGAHAGLLHVCLVLRRFCARLIQSRGILV